MELINRLPFPAMAFRQFDKDGKLDCVVAVRGTFLHNQGQPLEIMREQEEFQWEDAYDGDPHKGIILRQTDLTPEKPGTDVTFLGNAYAPEGRPSTNWTVSLRVGHLEKSCASMVSASGNRLFATLGPDSPRKNRSACSRTGGFPRRRL